MNDRINDHNLHIQNIKNLCSRAGIDIDDIRHNTKSGQHMIKLRGYEYDDNKRTLLMQQIANSITGSTYCQDTNEIMTNNCKIAFKKDKML